jgi:hypothetical protein
MNLIEFFDRVFRIILRHPRISDRPRGDYDSERQSLLKAVDHLTGIARDDSTRDQYWSLKKSCWEDLKKAHATHKIFKEFEGKREYDHVRTQLRQFLRPPRG